MRLRLFDPSLVIMVKTLTEQNKVMIEMMKTQSDKSDIPCRSNLVKRKAEIQQQSSKMKVIKFKMVPILNGSLAAPSGRVVGLM